MYSKEQIDRANQVDLVGFLRGQGEQLVAVVKSTVGRNMIV